MLCLFSPSFLSSSPAAAIWGLSRRAKERITVSALFASGMPTKERSRFRSFFDLSIDRARTPTHNPISEHAAAAAVTVSDSSVVAVVGTVEREGEGTRRGEEEEEGSQFVCHCQRRRRHGDRVSHYDSLSSGRDIEEEGRKGRPDGRAGGQNVIGLGRFFLLILRPMILFMFFLKNTINGYLSLSLSHTHTHTHTPSSMEGGPRFQDHPPSSLVGWVNVVIAFTSGRDWQSCLWTCQLPVANEREGRRQPQCRNRCRQLGCK